MKYQRILTASVFLLVIINVFANTNVNSSEKQTKLSNLDKIYSSGQLFTDSGIKSITIYLKDPNQDVRQAAMKLAYIVATGINANKISCSGESSNNLLDSIKSYTNSTNTFEQTTALEVLLLSSPKHKELDNASLWLIHKSPYSVRGPLLIMAVAAGYKSPNLASEIMNTIKEGELLEIRGITACYNSQLFGAIGLLKPSEGVAEILELINNGNGSTSAVRALAAYGPKAVIALPRLKELAVHPLVKRSDGAKVGIPVEEVINAISAIEKNTNKPVGP
jgi:hypothetical protein